MGPLPNHYQTNMRLSIKETSEAEGTADHVTLLRPFLLSFSYFLSARRMNGNKAKQANDWSLGILSKFSTLKNFSTLSTLSTLSNFKVGLAGQ